VQLPITIGLHRSRFIDTFILVVALLASLAILAFPRHLAVQATLLLVVWGIVLRALRQCSRMFSAIRLESDGRVSVISLGGNEFSVAELLPGATVHPWLTVLRLKTTENRILPLILAADSLEANDFRRLRVFLRWRADFSAPGGAA